MTRMLIHKSMTVHKSKGLEFPVVLLIGMSDGIFRTTLHSEGLYPSRAQKTVIDGEQEIEEMLRLAYAGVTRAREELYLSFLQKPTAGKM